MLRFIGLQIAKERCDLQCRSSESKLLQRHGSETPRDRVSRQFQDIAERHSFTFITKSNLDHHHYRRRVICMQLMVRWRSLRTRGEPILCTAHAQLLAVRRAVRMPWRWKPDGNPEVSEGPEGPFTTRPRRNCSVSGAECSAGSRSSSSLALLEAAYISLAPSDNTSSHS